MINKTMLNLKILQWNCRSAISNLTALKMLINEYNPDIVILCETFYKPESTVNLSGFEVVRKDRQSGKGGVAILIANSLTYSVINLNPNFNNKLEVCAINLYVKNETISVASAYRPPNVNLIKSDYINLINQLENKLVIAGDLNTQNTSWGSGRNNAAGNVLLEALDEKSNLIIRNNGSRTRICRPNETDSAVDMTIMSSDLICSSSWDVVDDSFGSDHFL